MRSAWIFALVLAAAPQVAVGQGGSLGMAGPEALQRAGLTRMWFTQLSMDSGRGHVAGIFQHVSPVDSHTVYQVQQAGKRYVFSERDRDAFGKEIGKDKAKEQAEQKVQELKQQPGAAGTAAAGDIAVETHVVPRITLYATSERGLVQAIDGETGRTLWTRQIGNPLYPTTAPAANDKFVGACNGSTLYVLNAGDGSVAWSQPTIGVPGAGPALSAKLIFVPMVNGQMVSRELDSPKRPADIYKSFGRTMTQPVLSTNSVAWATDSGNLYVGVANSPGVRFRLQAGDAVNTAPTFLPPDKVLIATLEGYLYCVSEQKGNILWRFTTGEPIDHSPIVSEDLVLVISTRGNVFAIDASTAAERWLASGISSFLAASDKRLYFLDKRGGLAVLDRQTGVRLATVAGLTCDVPLLNTQTDRIVLANRAGVVQALRESQRPFPLVHYLIEPPPEEARGTPLAGAPKPNEAAPPPTLTTDPFDAARPAAPPPPPAPAGADPFGPAAAAPAAPPAAAPGGDPFAPTP